MRFLFAEAGKAERIILSAGTDFATLLALRGRNETVGDLVLPWSGSEASTAGRCASGEPSHNQGITGIGMRCSIRRSASAHTHAANHSKNMTLVRDCHLEIFPLRHRSFPRGQETEWHPASEPRTLAEFAGAKRGYFGTKTCTQMTSPDKT